MKRGPEDQGYWTRTLSEHMAVRKSLLHLPLIKYLLNQYWAKPGLGVWTEREKTHKSFLSQALHSNGEAWVDRKWEVNSVFENNGRWGKRKAQMVQATLEAQKIIWGRPLKGSFWFRVYSTEKGNQISIWKEHYRRWEKPVQRSWGWSMPQDMSNKEASTARIRYKETRPQRTRGPAFLVTLYLDDMRWDAKQRSEQELWGYCDYQLVYFKVQESRLHLHNS